MKWCFVCILLAFSFFAMAAEPPLSYRLDATRTHGSNWDTVLVVATVRNVSLEEYRTWGTLEFTGSYKPSVETEKRWCSIRDSSIAATENKPELRVRDFYPQLPKYFIVPSAHLEGLKYIILAPEEAYSDTLMMKIYSGDFERWPGYIDIYCDFLMGAGPKDADNAVRIGKPAFKIAIPVP